MPGLIVAVSYPVAEIVLIVIRGVQVALPPLAPSTVQVYLFVLEVGYSEDLRVPDRPAPAPLRNRNTVVMT